MFKQQYQSDMIKFGGLTFPEAAIKGLIIGVFIT
jgi:hypothetical protein